MPIPSRRHIILALIAIFSVSATFPALAERTIKQVIVLDEPGGDTCFVLFRDAFIDCLKSKGSYVEIGLNITFPKESLIKEGVLKSGVPLIEDSTGVRIGKTLAETEVYMAREEKDGRWIGNLIGYIPRQYIDSNSIPEIALAAILNAKKPVITMADLNAHIARMRYDSWHEEKGYRSYYMTDNSVIDSAGFRLGLVLRQDTLIAVIHSRPLAVRFTDTEIVKDEQYTTGLSFSYVQQLSDKEKRLLREVFFPNLIYAN